MLREASAYPATLRQLCRAVSLSLVSVGIAVTMALFLLLGVVQVGAIRPPLGQVQIGSVALSTARQLSACSSAELASCRADALVFKLDIWQSHQHGSTYRLFYVPLR